MTREQLRKIIVKDYADLATIQGWYRNDFWVGLNSDWFFIEVSDNYLLDKGAVSCLCFRSENPISFTSFDNGPDITSITNKQADVFIHIMLRLTRNKYEKVIQKRSKRIKCETP